MTHDGKRTMTESPRFRARLAWERRKLALSEWWVYVRHGLVCSRRKVYVVPEDFGDVTHVRCDRCGIVLGEVA